MLNAVSYEQIDDRGLHIARKGKMQILEVDNVIICTGQEPRRDLYQALDSCDVPVHLIGGADRVVELDAKRAINQGCRLAATI